MVKDWKTPLLPSYNIVESSTKPKWMKTAIIFGFGIMIVVLMYLSYCKTSTELDSINDIKQDIQRIVDRGSKIEEEIDIFRDTENNHDKVVIDKFIDKELQSIMEAVEAIHAGAKIGEAICCDLSRIGTMTVLGLVMYNPGEDDPRISHNW